MNILAGPPPLPISGEDARSIQARSLDAQSELLPYALGFFGFALPMFVWAGAYASNSAWMSAIFVQFSLNWAAFYGVVNRMGWRGEARLPVGQRTLLHIVGGGLWALAVAEIALFGAFAGPVGDLVLAMAVGGAAACMFFASPSLPVLLTVGPAAAAAPLIALYLSHDRSTAIAASGAMALAMALALMVNRILRRQFALAAEREALIAERAASLAEAERLATSKSHILATLSHEIRNGLTGVAHVLAAVAGAGGRAAPSREQLSAALSGANELLDVLNATLDTEIAGAGKLVVAARPFDAAALARSAVLMCRPKAAGKTLELDLHIDEPLTGAGGAAMGDPVRVRQVLTNLIGNAIKYTARGRVEVRVLRSGEGRIRFEVADTGPGLAPDELERAFEPFCRIERVGLGVPGAGLGLSLSRDLARLMDGEVSAESAVGVGSRFWLDLPFDPSATPETERNDGDAELTAAGPAQGGLRVLIAEDDALNAAMLRAILEQLGHQVVHAHDGRRALELANFCQFDLIMLDGRMPHLTGPEAAREIRALSSAAREAPIIAVIGGDSDEAQACIAAGVNEVLRKPVTVAAVARAVASTVGAERDPGFGHPGRLKQGAGV